MIIKLSYSGKATQEWCILTHLTHEPGRSFVFDLPGCFNSPNWATL